MCRVFVSGRGNVFMREIAEHLVEALVLAGRHAELVIDELPTPGDDPLGNLVVAPHELFVLSDASEAERLRAAAACVCINTEQPGTTFFDLAMTYATRGPVVLDINRSSLDAVRRAGVPAVHLQLGCTPSMDLWGGGHRDRAIDLAFLSGRTPRRERFIAGAGSMLWEWRTDLRFFSWHRPVVAGDPSFMAGPDKFAALADTRILLNVHRGDEPYFEWARVVEAIANGCVVVSETSVGFEPLVPGVHFVMAPIDHLAEHAIALALDEPRRLAMAEAAYKLTTTDLSQPELVEAAHAEAAGAAERRGVRMPHLRPARRTARRNAPASAANDDAVRKTASDLKQAYWAQVRMSRRIEGTISFVEHGDRDHADLVATPAWAPFEPAVSVVIDMHDESRTVGDAVRSVIAATGGDGPATEIIIVDDHSTDQSCRVVERLLDEIEWFPAALVARAASGGPAQARNSGFGHARGAHVLSMCAADVVYPNAVRRLHEQLESAPADVVAAYGILERFDAAGSRGITSHLAWDPALLLGGCSIASMAMFRREAWSEIGGWSTDDEIDGLADHDLWLSIAELGRRAEQVRAIVGRRREPSSWMRTLASIDVASDFVTLRARHPRLPWPS